MLYYGGALSGFGDFLRVCMICLFVRLWCAALLPACIVGFAAVVVLGFWFGFG